MPIGDYAIAVVFAVSACAWLLLIGLHSACNIRNSPSPYSAKEDLVGAKRDWPDIDPALVMDSKDDRYFWFTQVSDIHISKYNYTDGAKHLEAFLETVLPFVNPLFVANTGDIVDGKNPMFEKSSQHYEEWKTYQDLLLKYNIPAKQDFWFDMRGNHDCFGVSGWNSDENYFKDMSIMKSRSYSRIFEMPYGKYSIIAIDGCPEYGPTRPLNFFGILQPSALDLLQAQLAENRAANVRHTLLLGHYPTPTMRFYKCTDGTSFEVLTKDVTAYLTGHLHRLIFGIGSALYATQPNGFSDFEVGDMKENGIYRVAAFDHDIFTFVDVPVAQSIVVLPTNPKDARLNNPVHENPKATASSTHIRVLVFAKQRIKYVHAICMGKEYKLKPTHSYEYPQQGTQPTPLWTEQWNPSDFKPNGVYKMTIRAVCADNTSLEYDYYFTVNAKILEPHTFARWILRAPLQFYTQVIFWSLYAVAMVVFVLPAWFLAFLRVRGSEKKWFVRNAMVIANSSTVSPHSNVFFRALDSCYGLLKQIYCQTALGLVRFAEHRGWSIAIVFYLLWLSVCPMFVARLEPKSTVYSAVFIWGIWRFGTGWTYHFDTWVYAAVSLALLAPAVLGLLIWAVRIQGRRSVSVSQSIVASITKTTCCFVYAVFASVALLANVVLQWVIFRAYGWCAVITNVSFTWPIAGIIIYCTALSLLFFRQQTGQINSKRLSASTSGVSRSSSQAKISSTSSSQSITRRPSSRL